MNNSLKGLGLTAWVALGFLWMAFTLFGRAGIANAAEQEFSGEVTRVHSRVQQVIMSVPDGHSVEGRQVVVRVDRNTDFIGFEDLSELKEGASVQVEARKNWYMRLWLARRLTYDPSEGSGGISRTDKAGLHDIENRSAHGQMGDIEFETKRQVFNK